MPSTRRLRLEGLRRVIVRLPVRKWRNRVFGKLQRLPGEEDTSPSDKRTLWFVTQNHHKYQEARRTLDPFGIKIRLLDSMKTEIQSTNLGEIAKLDRKSTRLNSSHQIISYAVFCLKKKKLCRPFGRLRRIVNVRQLTYQARDNAKKQYNADNSYPCYRRRNEHLITKLIQTRKDDST